MTKRLVRADKLPTVEDIKKVLLEAAISTTSGAAFDLIEAIIEKAAEEKRLTPELYQIGTVVKAAQIVTFDLSRKYDEIMGRIKKARKREQPAA